MTVAKYVSVMITRMIVVCMQGPLSEPPFGQLRTQMMLGSDDSDGVVFSTVLSYCMLILGGTIATFFVTKVGILSGLMGWDPEDNWTTVTSAIMAGMVTNTKYFYSWIKSGSATLSLKTSRTKVYKRLLRVL